MTSTIGFLLQDIEEHDLWGAVALNELHSKVPEKKKRFACEELCMCCEADNVERAKKKGKKSEKPEKDKSEAKAGTHWSGRCCFK